MKRLAALAGLAAVVSLLTGCAGIKSSPIKLDYYTLEYEVPQPANPAMTGTLPVVLRVERFTAAPEYETDRMIYRDSSNKRSVYNYHKWRATPADLVSYFLKRDLAAGNRFAGVLPPGSGTGNTHVLDGTVEEFLEWDSGTSCEAVVSVDIVLLDPKAADATRQVLLQERFSAREPCRERQPEFVARAMSRAMARLSQDIGAALDEVLRKNNRK